MAKRQQPRTAAHGARSVQRPARPRPAPSDAVENRDRGEALSRRVGPIAPPAGAIRPPDLSGLANSAPSFAGAGRAGIPPLPRARVAMPTLPRPTARVRESSARLFGDYSYVKRDLRRIAVLTIGALVILIAVSFLLPMWVK